MRRKHRQNMKDAITAAEQAEPLDNDVEVHRWQRAAAVQSRKLQMVLDIPGVRERLQEVTGSSDGYMLAGTEQAEAALAEAKRENEALEKAMNVCAAFLRLFIKPEKCIHFNGELFSAKEASDMAYLARNAGGKDAE